MYIRIEKGTWEKLSQYRKKINVNNQNSMK